MKAASLSGITTDLEQQARPGGEHPLALFSLPPLEAALAVFVTFLIVSASLGIAAKALLPQAQPEFLATVALSVLAALGLAATGWWRAAGFNRPAHWRSLGVLAIPFLIVLGLPFLAGIRPVEARSLLYLVAGYALTGFMEEAVNRGVILGLLQPLGTKHAVLISSLLFGLMHIGNLLYRSPTIVLAQMLGAFVHGIGLAAIRLRTDTIWFVIVLHGLHDLALKYTRFPAIPLDVVQVTLLMAYGLYLLRQRKQA